MPKRAERLNKLTDEQVAAMGPYADTWIRRGLDCTPVDHATVEDGIRRCYEYAGIPWHGNVIWVDSPLVVALAAPIASHLLVDGAVRGAVDAAVRGAVDGAVDAAVRAAVVRRWYMYIGGQAWVSWIAWRSYFRDVADLDLDGDTWDRHAAYEAANQAGWWWPHRQFVIVSERPQQVHTERVGERGWGSHQLHREDGPAISWGGWGLSFWHGVRVPSWVAGADGGPTLERIRGESNTEIRRCAVEAYGWGRYLTDLGVTPIDVAPDPGNPGRHLELYDLPAREQMYREPVRLLVMTNASVDRGSRSRRIYGETVPAEMGDAVTAAAWQFDEDPDLYRQLARAT